MSSPKIGIVCSGGGMTSAYSAGALEALYYHYGLTLPHAVVGATGCAGNCAYFTAEQIKLTKEIWCDHLTNSTFISYRRWPWVNLSYLIKTIIRKQLPLNIGKVRTSPIQLFIPVTNADSGVMTYFSNKNEVDLFEVLRAATTVPLVTGSTVPIDTQYFRSARLKSSQELDRHISLTQHYGCEAVIVIENQHATETNSTDPRTTVLRPSQSLQMSQLTNQREKVERAYDMGYQDAINCPHLKTLLGK